LPRTYAVTIRGKVGAMALSRHVEHAVDVPAGYRALAAGRIGAGGRLAPPTGRERWFSGGPISGRLELVPLVGGEAVLPGDRVPEGGECLLAGGGPVLWDG